MRQLQADVKEQTQDLAAAQAATGELRETLNEARAARQAAERQVRHAQQTRFRKKCTEA